MTLTLSDEQFRRLLTLMTLGEWMVNAHRKEPDSAYEALAAKIYAVAHETEAAALVMFEDEIGTWAPSDPFHEETQSLIDEYDDATFWEELPARLAERDLMATHGERAVQGMHPEERIRAMKSIVAAYAEEFEHQGLDRLTVTENRE